VLSWLRVIQKSVGLSEARVEVWKAPVFILAVVWVIFDIPSYMKISVSWLKNYVDFDWSPEVLAQKLTMAGIEVEGIQTKGGGLDKVLVCEIVESKQHPNADRLSVCQVLTSTTGTTRQIVCGAKNYKVGDRVPLATPGCKLPNGMTINENKLRGEVSQGMMCSSKELGLSEESEGLLILPPETPLGTLLSTIFVEETIFEVEITPNRPDLLCHIGVARELVALGARNFRLPEISFTEGTKPVSEALTVKNDCGKDCVLYLGRTATGVKVGPSPAWLKQRLESIGVRSVNNIVDVTNFVLHECGQPLHAFDAKRLVSSTITLRPATAGEKITALDGKTYPLKNDHLVIADDEKPIAIAGVMGGLDSSINNESSDIILETAVFRPISIRTSSRNLGLFSDSSYRFERGVNPHQSDWASQRAAHLIQMVAGGTWNKGAVQTAPLPPFTKTIQLHYAHVNNLLGTELTPTQMESVFIALGIKPGEAHYTLDVHNQKGTVNYVQIHVPSHRPDLEREIDLIEEVARIIGLHNVKSRLKSVVAPETKTDSFYHWCLKMRTNLAAQGFYEVLTPRLVSEAHELINYRWENRTPVKLRNPLSEDLTHLRTSQVANLLKAVQLNVNRQCTDVKIFELGKTFSLEQSVPRENYRLTIAASGLQNIPSVHCQKPEALDIFDLKGAISSLAHQLGASALTFGELHTPESPTGEVSSVDFFSIIFLGSTNIGRLGSIAPHLLKEHDIKTQVFVAEFLIEPLFNASVTRKSFTELPKFPAVERDLALIVDKSVPHGTIVSSVMKHKPELLKDVELFDVFLDEKCERLPVDKKSMAYKFVYQSNQGTLTDKQVNETHTLLAKKVCLDVQGTIRDN